MIGLALYSGSTPAIDIGAFVDIGAFIDIGVFIDKEMTPFVPIPAIAGHRDCPVTRLPRWRNW
jgi:hypothetical protein